MGKDGDQKIIFVHMSYTRALAQNLKRMMKILERLDTEVTISLISHHSSMHNISLKAAFDTLFYPHGLGK
jgi:hypothetical protein